MSRLDHRDPPNAPDKGAADPQLAGRVAVVAAAVTAGSLLVLLIALTFETKWGPALRIDNAARDDLHQYGLAHPHFTAFMQGVSAVSGAVGWQVVSVIAIAWLLLRRRFREAAFVLVANAGSSLLNTVLKDLVHRHRPVVTHPFLHAPGQSFPSGHAQAAATGFTVLVLVLWPHLHSPWMQRAMIVGAIAATLLIGYSRVALAAHFASDVVAGYIVGVAWTISIASALHIWPRPAVPTSGA